jgi:hypothetical protein
MSARNQKKAYLMYSGPARQYVHAELLPPDSATVDWQHKPSQFKLYHNCAQLPLPYRTSQNQRDAPEASLTLEQLGELLAEGYGLLQQCYSAQFPLAGIGITGQNGFSALRRSVPSGGALFPCELYLFLGTTQHLPAGIYHYDMAHHALTSYSRMTLRQRSVLTCHALAHLVVLAC